VITVANCTLLVAAQVIRATLESSGITAFIPDEFTVETAPHLALLIGGVRVQVADEDAPRAREILASPQPPELPNE
jgi:Putative prokaryotic signal transducing protein